MAERIEDYTEQKLDIRINIAKKLIRELQGMAITGLTQETLDQRNEALQKARQLYSQLASEYIRRKADEIASYEAS